MSLRRNLVAHWSLDEASGIRADSHGAGELVDNNTVLSLAGVVGTAADFETTNNEYLSAALADVGAAPGDADLMVACWVKLESKPTRVGIISTDTSATARSWRLDYDGATDRFRFLVFDGANAVAATISANNLGAPVIGTWYFIVAWHDATNSLGGIQINNGTPDTGAITGAAGSVSKQLYVGRYTPATAGTGFDGLIDEAAVWRRLLTTTEKATLYNSGAGYGWSNWFTDTGIAPLHVANNADIIAYDVNSYSYETTVNITQTGRHAIGMLLRSVDNGDQIELYVGGVLKETITIDNTRLANPFGSFFEDGFIYDFTTTGNHTIKLVSVLSASLLRRVIVRQPDSVSGIVEDQGAATHCEPLQCDYGGNTYRVHVEMYSGNVYLAKNGILQGLLFAGVQRNERYHVGASIVALAAGVAVLHVGHNYNGLRVRYLPGGAYASITSTYTTLATTPLTYVKAVALLDDRIAILTRAGSGQSPLLILVSGAAQIDGTGASATSDWVFAGVNFTYNNALEYYVNGSTEVLCCLFNSRDASSNWGPVYAAMFCPQEGTEGEWYSLNGDAATVNTARGTEATPRFDTTMRDTATGSGGIRVLADAASGQQYSLSGLFKVTQWPSGATNAKGALLLAWTASSGGLTDYSDSTAIRFLIQNEGTQTLDSSFGDLPTDDELSLTTNSYRLDATFLWVNDDDTNDAFLAITDRRWGKAGSGQDNSFEECGIYYDWGAHEISVLRIANPHTPATIAFSQETRIESQTKYRAAFITKAGTNTITYQPGDNQLHGTHRQSTRQVESFTIAGGVSVTIGNVTSQPAASGAAISSTHQVAAASATSQPAASGAAIAIVGTHYVAVASATSQPVASGVAISHPGTQAFVFPAPEKAGYQIAPVDQTIRTEMETGLSRVRRRSAARNDVVNLQWKLTDAEMAAFRAWFDSPTGAGGGAGWFTVDLAIGSTGIDPVEARFSGPWTADVLPGLNWRVTAKLEVR